MRKALETEKHRVKIDGKWRVLTDNEIIIAVLRSAAREGNAKAATLLWDRAYGKAVQPVDIEGNLQSTLEVILPPGFDKV